jgi:hypothetical protein
VDRDLSANTKKIWPYMANKWPRKCTRPDVEEVACKFKMGFNNLQAKFQSAGAGVAAAVASC